MNVSPIGINCQNSQNQCLQKQSAGLYNNLSADQVSFKGSVIDWSSNHTIHNNALNFIGQAYESAGATTMGAVMPAGAEIIDGLQMPKGVGVYKLDGKYYIAWSGTKTVSEAARNTGTVVASELSAIPKDYLPPVVSYIVNGSGDALSMDIAEAEQLYHNVRKLAGSSEIVLTGHSAGALPAQIIAARHPENTKAVTFNPLGGAKFLERFGLADIEYKNIINYRFEDDFLRQWTSPIGSIREISGQTTSGHGLAGFFKPNALTSGRLLAIGEDARITLGDALSEIGRTAGHYAKKALNPEALVKSIWKIFS